MRLKINSYTETQSKTLLAGNLPKVIMFEDSTGVKYEFIWDLNEPKYVLLGEGGLQERIFFDVLEDGSNVKILNIDLKELSNKSLGSQIIDLISTYAASRDKTFCLMLCSNFWLLRHMQQRFPNATIDVYDFGRREYQSMSINEANLFGLANEFRIQTDSGEAIISFNCQQKTDYAKSFSTLEDIWIELNNKGEILVFSGDGRAFKDVQLYLHNVTCSIYCSSK